jgi:L-fucose isomerase-like protein
VSTSIGIIIGNRDFFPDHLITEARNEILNVFKNKGINPIILKDSDTKLGGVETFLEAQKCAELFKAHQQEIEGNISCPSQFWR